MGEIKDFSTHTIIDVHRRRVHLNERLNPCEECNLTFASERALLKHLNIYHIDVNERRIYSCSQCNKKFTEWGILIRYEIEIHEEIKKS